MNPDSWRNGIDAVSITPAFRQQYYEMLIKCTNTLLNAVLLQCGLPFPPFTNYNNISKYLRNTVVFTLASSSGKRNVTV